MSNTLTNIPGIGKAAAVKLNEAGFSSIEDIAKTSAAKLGKVPGFGAARAERVIASAKSIVDGNAPVKHLDAKVEKVAPKAEKKAESKTAEKKTEGKTAESKTADKKMTDKLKIDPAIAAMAMGKFKSAKTTVSKPKVLIPAIAVVLLAGAAAANTNVIVSAYDSTVSKVSELMNKDMNTDVVETAAAPAPVQQFPAMRPVAMAPVMVPARMAPVMVPAKVATVAPKAAPRMVAVQRPVAPNGYRPYYPRNTWGNAPWNGNGFGNGFGNGNGSFSMSFSGKSNASGNGNGYGYNRPYYGAPYGAPRPIAYKLPGQPLKTK